MFWDQALAGLRLARSDPDRSSLPDPLPSPTLALPRPETNWVSLIACRGHQLTADDSEKAGAASGGSRMDDALDFYQPEGYHALLPIARQYGGAFLCDGVGLGKTLIGRMTIERLVMPEGKRVVLFVPKTARADVEDRGLREYLPHLGGTGAGDFSSLVIFKHTDLGRGGEFPHCFERVKELADAIVIHEAHHFRNACRRRSASSRS